MASSERRQIRTLATAAAVSNTGSSAATIALSLAVFAKTSSTVWLSVSFLLVQLPSALVAPLSGLIADRLDRRRVMITCDLLGALTYAGMALAGKPAALIALGAAATLLHAPFGPASRAAVPNLAGEGNLSWANGLLASAANVAQLAGPALGGALFALAGAAPAFWVNAASFVISAALLAVLRGTFSQPRQPGGRLGWGGTWAEVRFVRGEPVLLTLLVIGAVTFMATEITLVADLPLIRHFGVGGLGYGAMNVAWGAGGLAGGLIASRIVRRDREPAAAVLGVLVFGVLVAAVGASPWFLIIPVFTFLFAFSDSFAFVGFNGIYQRRTPDDIRGRVFAAVGGLTTLATAVSFGFAGFLVRSAGWRPVYLGGGLVDVLCGAALALALWRQARGPRAPRASPQADGLLVCPAGGENGRMVQAWRRWVPGRNPGMARGVAAYGGPGLAPEPDRMAELLSRCPALRSWAAGRGLALGGVPDDLALLDRAIEVPDTAGQIGRLADEVGLFLGTVITAGVAGARWHLWPNGHRVVRLASGRELDVVAVARDRLSRGGPWLADAYADAAGRSS